MYCVHPGLITEIDEYAQRELNISKYTLMRCAGEAAASEIMKRLKAPAKIIFLCGLGNNGGDGYVCARRLYCEGYRVTVINVFGIQPKTEISRHYRELCLELMSEVNLADMSFDKLSAAFDGCSAVVECIFGTGYKSPAADMPEPVKRVIGMATESRVMRIAMDSPTGVNGVDGTVGDCVFNADLTITMMMPKTGFFIYPAREYVGELAVCDIGIDINVLKNKFPLNDYVTDSDFLRENLKRRVPDSHKGTYGRALLVCGSSNMPGAAYLACSAALRSGVGLCALAASGEVKRSVSSRLAEPIYFTLPDCSDWTQDTVSDIVGYSRGFDALLIGCGVGNHSKLKLLIEKVLAEEGCPVVLDADALNAISGCADMLKSSAREVIITPHPLEFSRLCGKSTADIQADRYNCAKDFAREYGVIVVLKGAGTLTALPDGKVFINTTGNSGLAKGGSGDILSGLIVSLLAQGNEPHIAAAAGAYLHGLAAERLTEKYCEYGLLPSDLPCEIGRLMGDIVSVF